jgi:carboxymethylenebutenolidase
MARLEDVTVPTPDGPLPAVLALPETPGLRPAVIVQHEHDGLNEDIRRICRRLAAEGYVALGPDFLAGLGRRPFCMARFMRGLGKVGAGRPYRQLQAAQDWLEDHRQVARGRVGVAGFCIGGGFAILYAMDGGKGRLRAIAPFYAAVPKDESKLEGICPVVASFGRKDRVFRGGAARLERALTRLGVPHDVKLYPDAGHSFMNRVEGGSGMVMRLLPGSPGYHEASAEDAWRRTLEFFNEHLDAGTARV